jgi:hypothetical protein
VAPRDPWSLLNVLALAAGVTIVLGLRVVVDLDGWSYYATPLRVRGYAPLHTMLKPSGSLAHRLGVAGLALLVVPVLYAVRKRWRRLTQAGSMRAWLEVHIFCGIVGPALVTFHTAFRFNGLISVAYWSMMAVMLSGFVGRYLYVRIPRTIRGVELSRDDIHGRIDQLTHDLAVVTSDAALPDRVRMIADAPGNLPRRPGAIRRRVRRELAEAGVGQSLASAIADAFAERAQFSRRLATLNRTRALFSAWHVFHLPLVYVMFAIVAVHVGVAVYFGYSGW